MSRPRTAHRLRVSHKWFDKNNWIYEGSLRIEYQDTLLAQYQADYDQRQKHFQHISQPTLYQTPFASPQLALFELDDEHWLKVYHRVYERRQKRIKQMGRQPQLINLEIAV